MQVHSTGTYAWLKEWLDSNISGYLAPNTYAGISTEGVIEIRLYSTLIMQVLPTNVMILTAGKFHTVTTKARLNAYLPKGVEVFQKAGVWYVGAKNGDYFFYDGIAIDCDSGHVWTGDKADRKHTGLMV